MGGATARYACFRMPSPMSTSTKKSATANRSEYRVEVISYMLRMKTQAKKRDPLTNYSASIRGESSTALRYTRFQSLLKFLLSGQSGNRLKALPIFAVPELPWFAAHSERLRLPGPWSWLAAEPAFAGPSPAPPSSALHWIKSCCIG